VRLLPGALPREVRQELVQGLRRVPSLVLSGGRISTPVLRPGRISVRWRLSKDRLESDGGLIR
jgi:hypothetical protein